MQREGRAVRPGRLVLVFSGGGALAAYQAGAFGALAAAGLEPDWVAGIGTGAANAAIIAGNRPTERLPRLRRFWRGLGELARAGALPSVMTRLRLRLVRTIAPRTLAWWPARALGPRGAIDAARLRGLLQEVVDFDRLNAGMMRLSLGAIHLPSGAETCFDNDRHRLTPDHLMASLATPPRFPSGWVDGQPYGGDGVLPATPLHAVLDGAPPADTLCVVVDGFDPAPGGGSGMSRTRQQIAAYRRRHELCRIVGSLGDRLSPLDRADPEVRRGLAQGSNATMSIVHLVHDSSAIDLAIKTGDFAPATVARRWQAGARDMAASLAHPSWLAPPPRRTGIVVHEMRGGTSSLLR